MTEIYVIKNANKVQLVDHNTGFLKSSECEEYFLSDIIDRDYKGNFKGYKLSNSYYYLEAINDDQYIASSIGYNNTDSNLQKYNIAIKYGIIKLTRDEDGKIIPMGEEIIVPFAYDHIDAGGLKTVIATVNIENDINDEYWDRYTYIDVDPLSENYGKQLVPAVLQYAELFEVGEDKLEDNFARCNVFYPSKEEVIPRYIPRNFCPVDRIKDEDLLTEEEMIKSKELYNPNSKAAIKKILQMTKFN